MEEDIVRAGISAWFGSAAFGAIQGNYGNYWNANRVVLEGLAGGVSAEIAGGNFSDGFKLAGGFSLLRWGALSMRQAMVEQSCTPSGNPNCTGESIGALGDRKKIAGGRMPEGKETWEGVRPSPLGGNQGGPGLLFGSAYPVGGFRDWLLESYSGPHDWFSSFRYGPGGSLMPYNTFERALYEVYSFTAITFATPFAIATRLPSNLFVPVAQGRD
jgi:filamentous hemagglutinin